jgi:hypothetical protein
MLQPFNPRIFCNARGGSRPRLPRAICVLFVLLLATYSFASIISSNSSSECAITLVSESSTEILLDLRLGIVSLDTVEANGQPWSVITAQGMSRTTRVGWPDLPQKAAWLALNSEQAQLEIIADSSFTLSATPVQPAAQPLLRSEKLPLIRTPAAEGYTRNVVFPAAPVALTMIGSMASARVALVTFSPIQYLAATRELNVHRFLRVRVSLRGRHTLDSQNRPQAWGKWFARMVINPHGAPPDSAANPRLLLVADSAFFPALTDFVNWKWQSGVPVRMISYSQVASNAEGLRAYIRHLCDSLPVPPEYLLLVGDVDVIPAFFGLESTLTDHPYSLLSDDDFLPDISVGRVPAHAAADVETWVQRVLAYERDAALPPTLAGTVFASQVAFDPNHGISMTGLLQHAGLFVDQLQEPPSASLTQLIGSLNAGRQWVFYIGHGFAQGWLSVHPAFGNEQVNDLTAPTAPLVVSVACATADLDYPGLSLAESWFLQPGLRGPVAFFGASENTAFFVSDTIGLSFMREAFLGGCERIGQATDAARVITAQCFAEPPGGLTEETIQQFMLLGDPSMRLFTRAPQPLNVTCPTRIVQGTRVLAFTVQQNGAPLRGAEICIMSPSPGVYRVLRTDSVGAAACNLPDDPSGSLQVTITAPNARPFQREIPVLSGGHPFLQITHVGIVDSLGDHDGQADRGEQFHLALTLTNGGNAASTTGELAISSADTQIVFAETEHVLPAIAPHDTLVISSDMAGRVSNFASDGHLVLLTFTARGGGDDSSQTTLPLLLHAPVMEFVGATLREDSGDGDHNPEAGERLALELRWINVGSDVLHSPSAAVQSQQSQVQVAETRIAQPSVVAHDTLLATVILRADSSVARGFPFEYVYQLSAANLPAQSGWNTQRVGSVPVFLYVLDPQPEQVDSLEVVLNALGIEHERGPALPMLLDRYASVWIFCGIFPNTVALSSNAAQRLALYLDGGGNCYWEGGDVWVFDPRTVLHPYFRIRGLNDGTSNAGPISGQDGTPFSSYRFDYAGENSFIDQLAPDTGATVLLRNTRPGANYAVCIAHQAAAYHTVGSSVELGSLTDGIKPSTRVNLFREILGTFGIESRPAITPPVVASASVQADALDKTSPGTPWQISMSPIDRVALTKQIQSTGDASWAITEYDGVPVLELHAGQDAISWTTSSFDASHLTDAHLSFWQFLRAGDSGTDTLARIVGSTDGGRTFSHSVWQYARQRRGVLESGHVITDDLAWMCGCATVALRFEFSGKWYWRLRDLTVSGNVAPQLAPVKDLVIAVERGLPRLLWHRVPEAKQYVVQATGVKELAGGFESIATISDTTFLDRKTSYRARFYQVQAILSPAIELTAPLIASPSALPVLREPDLRWNRKLESLAR